MKYLHIDYETYSELDIKKVGGIRYSEECEILMLGYAIDDEEPKLWIPNIPKDPGVQDALEFYGFIVDEDIPEDLRAALCNENVLIYAHNADFERAVNENQLFPTWMLPKVDSKRYRCTAAMCRYLALPGDLDGAGTALKLFEKKDKAGKALITKYCKPKKPTKNDPRTRRYLEDDIRDYLAFGDYCIQDVKTERATHKKLDKISMTSWEWEVYRMTSDINFNGLPIDVETVKKAQALVLEYQEREIERCRELTAFMQREYDQENNTMREIGEERISPTQTQKLLWWVNNELRDPSLRLENLQAATIDGVLKSDKYPEHVKEPLRIRRSISRASVKKIFPMTGCAGRLDARVRGTLLYHGATTGRWTARLIQPHNLPKPKIKNTRFALECIRTMSLNQIEFFYDDLMEVVSGCIRHFIHTKPGTDFIAADYSSIEARVNCYLADQRHAIKLYQKDLESQQRFQNGEISAEQRKKEKWALDQYVDMAGAVYKIDNIEVTDAHRDLGKCIILGCGFGMGKKTFYETCLNWGLNISKELAGQSVDAYRAKYYNIVKFWYKVEELAIKAIKTGKVQKYQQIQFAYKFGYLFIKLPSGRTLSYPKAYLKPTKTSWGEMKETIHFYGNIKGTLWGTVTTYGGKLVENIVQGASRDIMAHGMLNAEKAGYPPIGTVHDEGITEVNLKFGSVTEYERLLCDLPDWAKGMPIAAEGFRDIMYQK